MDGAAMDSPLDAILANIFFWHHEENWINESPVEFRLTFYGKCVDDIVLLFTSLEPVHSFQKCMSLKHITRT